jgi:hypothetical protein
MPVTRKSIVVVVVVRDGGEDNGDDDMMVGVCRKDIIGVATRVGLARPEKDKERHALSIVSLSLSRCADNLSRSLSLFLQG